METDPITPDLAGLRRMNDSVALPRGEQDTEFVREFNEAVVAEMRANAGRLVGELSAEARLIVTVRGRRSGRPYSYPLARHVVDDRLFVIASTGGADANPQWFDTMVANPEVEVELGGARFRARSVVTSGDDRDAIFREVVQRAPVFQSYQEKTSRVLPVVELVPIDADVDLGEPIDR